MRALLASILMALALLWVSATGGRAPVPLGHFPAAALSPWAASAPVATFTPSGQHARALLTSGRQARRGPGFQPLPLVLSAPPALALPSAGLAELLITRRAPARAARLRAHGPRAPPACRAPVLFS